MKEPTPRQARALRWCRDGLARPAVAAAVGTSEGNARQGARVAELKELRSDQQAAKSSSADLKTQGRDLAMVNKADEEQT